MLRIERVKYHNAFVETLNINWSRGFVLLTKCLLRVTAIIQELEYATLGLPIVDPLYSTMIIGHCIVTCVISQPKLERSGTHVHYFHYNATLVFLTVTPYDDYYGTKMNQ